MSAPKDRPEDWKVGDLAICIAPIMKCRCGDPACIKDAPRYDQILRVNLILPINGVIHLGFSCKPASKVWRAACFRKVQPDTQPAAEDAWVEQLRHLRRKDAA